MRIAAALLAAWACAAQTPDTVAGLKPEVAGQKIPEVDLSVPESPAFAALGLTPDNIVRPSSPRALATSILNGVDPNGNFQTGLAIDAAPYFLAYGPKIRLADYRLRYSIRFLSRIQLSLATAKGTSENDKAARIGAGLRLTPWDAGDYRMNRAFIEELNALPGLADEDSELTKLKAKPTDPEAVHLKYLTAREAFIRRMAAPIREKYRKKNWNASGFSLGFSPTWISQTGTAQTSSWNGGAAWASMAYGFENVPGLDDSAQVIIHARYRNKDRVPVPGQKNQYYTQDSTLVGARARFGAVDTNASFEFVYLFANPRILPNESYARITGGLERRILENIWLQLSVGGESGRSNNENHLLLLTGFKWAFGPKP